MVDFPRVYPAKATSHFPRADTGAVVGHRQLLHLAFLLSRPGDVAPKPGWNRPATGTNPPKTWKQMEVLGEINVFSFWFWVKSMWRFMAEHINGL